MGRGTRARCSVMGALGLTAALLAGCAGPVSDVVEDAAQAFAPEPVPLTDEEMDIVAALERLGVETGTIAPGRALETDDRDVSGAVVETDIDGGFAFGLPGDLTPGSGAGVWDTLVHAPGIRFPLESAPAYINTQVWGVGGLMGPTGSECAAENYSYPWRDNFCEARNRDDGRCPGGSGQLGVDIRPATCENNVHWAVAAADGKIASVGRFSVVLRGDSGLDFHYLHVNTDRLAVRRGQRVRAGDRIGLVSNYFDGTPTTVHLHFEIRREIATEDGTQSAPLSPYLSLVEAYLRLLPGRHATSVAALVGALQPREAFKDCDICPLMVPLAPETAPIGPVAAGGEDARPIASLPRRAIGVTEVTFAQWDACAADGYCHPIIADGGAGRGAAPVVNVSRWDIEGRPDVPAEDRQGGDRGFLAWLNAKVDGAPYRLPSEAEWETAARGGQDASFGFGAAITPEQANFDARFFTDFPTEIRFRRGPVPAGSLPANPYGLHEMHGNVWEWTSGCATDPAVDADGDGDAAALLTPPRRSEGGCDLGVRRGGSLFSPVDALRAGARAATPPGRSAPDLGFRVARDVPQFSDAQVRLVRSEPSVEEGSETAAASASR